jgi:hypothetical protein
MRFIRSMADGGRQNRDIIPNELRPRSSGLAPTLVGRHKAGLFAETKCAPMTRGFQAGRRPLLSGTPFSRNSFKNIKFPCKGNVSGGDPTETFSMLCEPRYRRISSTYVAALSVNSHAHMPLVSYFSIEFGQLAGGGCNSLSNTNAFASRQTYQVPLTGHLTQAPQSCSN